MECNCEEDQTSLHYCEAILKEIRVCDFLRLQCMHLCVGTSLKNISISRMCLSPSSVIVIMAIVVCDPTNN